MGAGSGVDGPVNGKLSGAGPTTLKLIVSWVLKNCPPPGTPLAPAAGTAGTPLPPARPNRAPVNLQVLPKDTTGQQLREIMAQWNSALGVQCNTCHTEDAKNLNPNGKPRLLCADDTKPEKTTTRTMYKLTGTINQSVGKIGSTGTQVTCGTCHRGHLTPEAFVAPPTANQRPTQAAPSAGAAPQPQS